MTKNTTIKELAALIEEDYQTTAGLIKFLLKGGMVKEVGSKPADGGRGKPSKIYEIPNEVELVFWEDTQNSETPEKSNEEKEDALPEPVS